MSIDDIQQLPDTATMAGETATSDATQRLSVALKRATRQAHHDAENSGVIRQLVTRRATRASYICLLRNLYPVYEALEQGLCPLRQDTEYRVLTDPALSRAAAIAADLSLLTSSDWRTGIPLLGSASEYARRLKQASSEQLVAHAYVRYLGDLNGGLILKRLLRQSLALDNAELSYYEFPAIDDIESFRERFKIALDALGLRLNCDAVIEEALLAFAMANAMSIEIEAHHA